MRRFADEESESSDDEDDLELDDKEIETLSDEDDLE